MRRILNSQILSLSNSLFFINFLIFILFPAKPCSITLLFFTFYLSPSIVALNTSKLSLIFLFVIFQHISFHLFTTLFISTKEPVYTNNQNQLLTGFPAVSILHLNSNKLPTPTHTSATDFQLNIFLCIILQVTFEMKTKN